MFLAASATFQGGRLSSDSCRLFRAHVKIASRICRIQKQTEKFYYQSNQLGSYEHSSVITIESLK